MAGANSSDAALLQQSYSFRQFPELGWIFDELPKATIVSVSRPDTGDISPMLLSYTIELQYKQVLPLSLSLPYYPIAVIHIDLITRLIYVVTAFGNKKFLFTFGLYECVNSSSGGY